MAVVSRGSTSTRCPRSGRVAPDRAEHNGQRGEEDTIDIEPDGERGPGADAGADTPELLPLDCLVELDRVAPEDLVTEGVEAEGLPPLNQHLLSVLVDRPVEGRLPVIQRHRSGR